MYTPTHTRTPGFESFRDDHGIVFEKKRNVVKRVLVMLRLMGDGDSRREEGLRGIVGRWWKG